MENDPDSEPMLVCSPCGLRYQPSKSTSDLRLTYCSILCEIGDLGFSIAGLEHMQRQPQAIEPPAADEVIEGLDLQPGEPAVVD